MNDLYWHFLPNDRRLANGDGRIVAAGSEFHLTDTQQLSMCSVGFHASRRAIDALQYAPGDVICRVELLGDVIHGGDKSVASGRRVVWMANAAPTLHEFACRCAETALKLIDKPDPRSVAAIDAKRAWLRGGISDDQLAAARAAAGAAARAPAWDAASDAAWAAAWAAAGAAAGAAAWAAAGAAAWAAAWDAQNTILEQMLSALAGGVA